MSTQDSTTRDWWEQPTREQFMAAHQAQVERLLLSGQTHPVARAVDAMVTAQWARGFSRPRPLSGVAQ